MTHSPITDARNAVAEYTTQNLPVNLERLCEERDIEIITYDMTALETKTGRKINSFVRADLNPVTIYISDELTIQHSRIALAVSLGYVFMQIQDIQMVFCNYASPTAQRASRIAEELLMPEELVREEHAKLVIPICKTLAESFHVPEYVMRDRLRRLELMHI